MQDDFVQSFQVEGANLRGRVVRLGSVAHTILTRHAYPEPVSRLMGESLALTSLLASMLKFDGIFTLQVKAGGPVTTLMTDFRTPGDLRGYAAFDEEALRAAMAESGGPSGVVPRFLGSGYLAFTVDQGENSERYQGIVELKGASLADCVHGYFQQSEQLQTGIRVAARLTHDEAGRPVWRAGGIMLQRLPPTGSGTEVDEAEDAWRRALMLIGTVSDAELVDRELATGGLLLRLFHEDGVRVYDAQHLGSACRCSRQRVEHVLRSFPAEDLADMVVEGRITATCQFCNTLYEFEPASVLARE
ncbi:MAG: Hsp33 family molecular chaperone [Alphaproteobacteria bacterium]|nr:Hsp33 family molecular chaperone [Alphaproteobacteria bacterium]